MPGNDLPQPAMTLERAHARRFLLAHQHLWPPRAMPGKPGALAFIRHVGCIQFDPVSVVGRNPDLVLQARVAGYRPAMLQELLYQDRCLLDGWDKMQSIHLAADWPCFARHRAEMRRAHGDPSSPAMSIAPQVLAAIRERGPLSSADLEHRDTVRWSWGNSTRLGRASLEVLYAMGEVGIHHRVGTRRYFDLTERLLPTGSLSAPDPNDDAEAYQDWHVLRRVGGLGLANPGATEYWLGILHLKTAARKAALGRLVARGELLPVALEGAKGRTFFLRTRDRPLLEAVLTSPTAPRQAALLPPLDNLLWDRDLVRWVFGFDYIWEVYKPAPQRKYGFYVLPVLYGDRLVARCEAILDRKTALLRIGNWWWEEDAAPDEEMEAALEECLREFAAFAGARSLRLGEAVSAECSLRWVGRIELD